MIIWKLIANRNLIESIQMHSGNVRVKCGRMNSLELTIRIRKIVKKYTKSANYADMRRQAVDDV